MKLQILASLSTYYLGDLEKLLHLPELQFPYSKAYFENQKWHIIIIIIK